MKKNRTTKSYSNSIDIRSSYLEEISRRYMNNEICDAEIINFVKNELEELEEVEGSNHFDDFEMKISQLLNISPSKKSKD